MYERPQTRTPETEKIIWDLPLRLFHWLMVIVVLCASISGYFFPDGWLIIHAYAGYALGLLLTFRLIWGFMGSYYSRFHTFPLKTKQAISHLKSLSKGHSQSYAGHNPVGAWMIVALLTTLSLLVITGLVVWGGEENSGPLASLISYKTGDAVEDIHEGLAGILMWIIGIHLLGVFVETKIFDHPVIEAMITGKKSTTETVKAVTGWVTFRGAFIFTAVIVTVVFLSLQLPNQAKAASILDEYSKGLKTDATPFTGFSAGRGKAFFLASPATGKPASPSCTSCHTQNPLKVGQTRAGKSIEPMAISASPMRYSDSAKVEKWFRRNCNSVLGRVCTALEKGDFITFMKSQ